MKLLVATQNKGKIREYQRLLSELPEVKVLGLDEFGLEQFSVEETGMTFHENALLKAKAYAEQSSILTLADDSGLVVDALNGRPGVYSARYGGVGLDDAGRRAYLLSEMEGIPDDQRTARFVCVIAVYNPQSNQSAAVEGACEGRILQEERDAGYGFGYDPLFQPDRYTKSFAELEPDIKNQISHRGVAAGKLPDVLRRFR